MQFCYFAFFEDRQNPAVRISADDLGRFQACVRNLQGLVKAHLYTPATASDLYTNDGRPPIFGLQLYFDAIASLESAIGPDGALKRLAESGELESLRFAHVTQQAMLNREFPVPDPALPGTHACSFLVHYPGPADDVHEWHAHYLTNHPPLMARFPGVREIEVLTGIDWIDAMPWRRIRHMQRNRVMFDSADALTAALHSPVRHEMRADFARLPPFQGGNFHYPMATEIVRPLNRREANHG